MLCKSCGNQINDGQKFCPTCGAPAQVEQQVNQVAGQGLGSEATTVLSSNYEQPQQMGQQTYYQQPQQQQYYNQQGLQNQPAGYEKLGGWLMFYTILFFLAGLGGIGNLIAYLTQLKIYRGYEWFPIIIGIIYLAGGVQYFLAGLFIVQKNPKFLFFIESGLFTLIFAVLFQNVIAPLFVGYFEVATLVSALIGCGIGYGLSFLIQLLYFTKSQRVRVYMGSTEYFEKSITLKKYADR